jgi:hypothetical protein
MNLFGVNSIVSIRMAWPIKIFKTFSGIETYINLIHDSEGMKVKEIPKKIKNESLYNNLYFN